MGSGYTYTVAGVAVTESHCTLVVVQKTATTMTLVFKGQFDLLPFKIKKVFLTCQTKEMVVKCMHAPLQNSEKVTQFLKEKMGQYVVFSGADIVIDWLFLGKSTVEGIPQQKGLAGAFKKEMSAEIRTMLSKMGLILAQICPPLI